MRIVPSLFALTLVACGGGGGTDADLPPVYEVTYRLHDDYKALAYITWRQREDSPDTYLEYQITGEEEWKRTPSAAAGIGKNEALIVGVPYATEFTFRIVNALADGPHTTSDFLVETGKLPGSLPVPELNVADSAGWDTADNYLLGSINEDPGGWTGGTYWKWIVDREGRFVWASKTRGGHWSIFLRTSVDKTHILWDEATYWSNFDLGADSKVYRQYLDGTILQTHDTPGLHHAFTELPDGSLLYGAATWSDEALIEQAPDGSETVLWECLNWQQTLYGTSSDPGYYYAYCQSNTLYYHEPTDSIVYSFYTSNSAVEIDRGTGSVVRHFGDLPGSYAFDPPQSQFWFQHGVHITDTGTLLLSSHQEYFDATGVVREYEIDDATQTLHEVWNQGLDGPYSSNTAGEAHRLANGNTIHNYGATPVVQEVTPDGTVVWEVQWESSRLIGRTTFMDDLYSYVPWPDTFLIEAGNPDPSTTSSTATE